MDWDIVKFFYWKQSVDNELAAYQSELRTSELIEAIKDLRSELGDSESEKFEEHSRSEQILYIGADGRYSEFKQLEKLDFLEVEKWNLLKMKMKLLETYDTLQERLRIKESRGNEEQDRDDLRNYG